MSVNVVIGYVLFYGVLMLLSVICCVAAALLVFGVLDMLGAISGVGWRVFAASGAVLGGAAGAALAYVLSKSMTIG